jgi:class 3 adenylate cyclase
MDAAGSESAVVWGVSEGGSMALVFAATYPKRTRALIVEGGQARWVRAPDMPWGIGEDEYRRVIDELSEHGVTESYIRGWVGGYGAAAGPDTIESLMRYFRAGASPASIAALERMNMAIDVREILPSIAVPTLIINGTNDPVSPIEGARYLAEAIPGARLHEYESDTHLASSREQGEALLDAVVEFMTGTRPPPRIDRVLATVLFTDIVDSTKTAAELGDARWRELLAQHDAIAREEIARASGRYVESTGDGLLATFDGPARAVRCAQAIAQGVHSVGLRIRAGCHTGEIELAGEAIRGVAVHIGARVAALAGPDDVWTSSTVKDLTVGSGLVFEDEGEHELKGVPGPWHLYRAVR